MELKKLKVMALSGLGLLFASVSGVAAANATIHYQDGSSEALPTSYADAVSQDFFYQFNSWIPVKDGAGWHGQQTDLSRSFITASCNLKLGGYIWTDKADGLVKIAVTHGTTNQAPPAGSGASNSATCSSISLEFNNGYNASGFPAASAGAWVTSYPISSLPTFDDTGVLFGTFDNVQVDTPLFGYCSTEDAGSGGHIDEVGFSNNGIPGVDPAPNKVSFDFDNDIEAPNGIACSVNGKLYSAVDKLLNSPDHTPGTPNPSPLSRGLIQYISQ
ncbi:hypothetical protein [Alloalcanivorax venustensis]|uniref:hypothetical protein n=1 Tax=Alloalcanivorax TaxID=3020832 RepID=UPI002EC54273|nr:hypothetical protein [Pseudomonadota bacterium]